ncbi:MAG: class I SAM-dependent methyltransferase [Caulobacteraceae bacterium]
MPQIAKVEGRRAFGEDPECYDKARPDYPDWIFEVLAERCGLRPGARTLEIGPGTGKATRRLLAAGADPLVAIEPDARLAAFLAESCASSALAIINAPFEEAEPEGPFDLVASATSFHWLEEDAALAKIARLLRSEGWWAAWWNVFGDPARRDPFHQATKELLKGPWSPSQTDPERRVGRPIPPELDADERRAAIERTGAFEEIEHRRSAWTLKLSTDQMVRLYATFSPIALRPDREAVLEGLATIAEEQFGGRIMRNMTTSLYIARRR